MKTHAKLAYLPGVVVLAFAILACTVKLPFLQPTPTATFTKTATSTSTSTATFTPSPSPTPLPPVTIRGCLSEEECPQANLIASYFPEDIERYANMTYPVALPYADQVRFAFGWCALDQAALDQNLQNIEFVFEIDGTSYLNDVGSGYLDSYDEENPYIVHPCYYIGAALSGWQIGEQHEVTIGMRILAEINDGWDTYYRSNSFYIYKVQPADLPTATPTATVTNTPRPLPTIPYYTPTPACQASSAITITNSTGGTVTLYLNGPANYVFYLGTGDTTLSVCPGTYSYTAYGCGGASDSGSMTSGDGHEFYCQ
jgi:hypothetical protein